MKSIKEICFIAIYVSIIITFQTILSSINGIEFTTLLIASAVLLLPITTSLFLVFIYCLIEGLLFGFGDWVLIYLIYWTSVSLITFIFKNKCFKNNILFSILNGINSFLLGIFFAIEMYILYDYNTAISYYLTGLNGDLTRLIFNLLSTLILFPFIKRIFPKIIPTSKSKKL